MERYDLTWRILFATEDMICHRGTEALNWFNVFFLCFRASVAIIKILLCCGTQGQRIIVLQKDQAIAPVAFLRQELNC